MIAKALYVQRQLFVEDGWNVQPCILRPVIEAALRQHELKEAPSKSSLDLHRLLFDECGWVKKKLQKCTRLHCYRCYVVCENKCFRLCRKQRSDDMKFHHVFCKECYRKVSAVSGELSGDHREELFEIASKSCCEESI